MKNFINFNDDYYMSQDVFNCVVESVIQKIDEPVTNDRSFSIEVISACSEIINDVKRLINAQFNTLVVFESVAGAIQQIVMLNCIVSNNSTVSWAEYYVTILQLTKENIRNVLVKKGKEYSRNDNRLHNFVRASEKYVDAGTPIQVCWGLLLKHAVSIDDIYMDKKDGISTNQEIIDEKFTDLINYLILLLSLYIAPKLNDFQKSADFYKRMEGIAVKFLEKESVNG